MSIFGWFLAYTSIALLLSGILIAINKEMKEEDAEPLFIAGMIWPLSLLFLLGIAVGTLIHKVVKYASTR
jgi:uncharacterized integral membrane protein